MGRFIIILAITGMIAMMFAVKYHVMDGHLLIVLVLLILLPILFVIGCKKL